MLILDEPANGLDPAGIRWMRDLLRGYADRGGTVLLSSHLLHEIEVIADDLVVIGNGRIVAQGTKSDLLAARRHLRPRPTTPPAWPRPSPPPASPSPTPAAGRTVTAPTCARRRPECRPLAHAAGVALIELRAADGAGLEEMFLELTADTQRRRSSSMSTTTTTTAAPHPRPDAADAHRAPTPDLASR